MSPRTKMIVLTSPHTPFGARRARAHRTDRSEHELTVMSDEVVRPIPSLARRVPARVPHTTYHHA